MNNIRSLANNPKLDKHEKPKSAKVKKKMPVQYAQYMAVTEVAMPLPNRFWNPAISLLNECNEGKSWNPISQSAHVRNIMEEQPTNYCHNNQPWTIA